MIVVLVGYWAVFTIEPWSVHLEKQKQKELAEKNEQLEAELERLKNELGAIQPEAPIVVTPVDEERKPPETSPTSSKHQTLISELEKLITANVFMKVGSQGTRVGTVQNFLNIYNKTSKTVDNDYGPGTKTDVTNFQKAVGITADGEAGPGTFRKMVEWLKKQ